jgi:hypothetical protein
MIFIILVSFKLNEIMFIKINGLKLNLKKMKMQFKLFYILSKNSLRN